MSLKRTDGLVGGRYGVDRPRSGRSPGPAA